MPEGAPAGPHVEVAVGAVILHDGHVLLIRRGTPPAAGRWTFPGGRVRYGEELHEALVREVREETGIEVVVDRFLDWVERIATNTPEPHHFLILDFLATPLDPLREPVAGDDAADVRWQDLDLLDELPLVEGMIEFLEAQEIVSRTRRLDL